MNKEIPRFDIKAIGYAAVKADWWAVESDDGDWIRYEDYEEVVKELLEELETQNHLDK